MGAELITSTQNPKIKDLTLLLEKSKERRQKGLFAVEGIREISNCAAGGFTASALFYCPEIISERDLMELRCTLSLTERALIPVAPNVYQKIAYRGTTEGAVALFKSRDRRLEDIVLQDNKAPLVLVLESVEKPGNLGAILRTADAAGVDAVIVCDPLTDLYNPNLIRASISGVFTLQIATATSQEAAKWLRERSFNILTAQLQDSKPYYDIDMTVATAIVFGTEADGLSDFWREQSNAKILIPMLGKLDSLNVSVSAAVLCYEAVRQRNKSR